MGDTIRRHGSRVYVPGGQFGPATTPFWMPIIDEQASPRLRPPVPVDGWWGRDHGDEWGDRPWVYTPTNPLQNFW